MALCHAEELMDVRLLSLTGLPSAGKTRLAQALEAAGLRIARTSGSLRIHAESDLEGFLDAGPLREARNAARDADLVIPVDWERPQESVRRVKELIASRG